jgi:hypothetical protein
MPDEVVQKIVGKDVITRIRKNDVAKIKKANTTQATKQAIKNAITDNKDKGSKKGEKKQLTFKDFFKV